MMIYYNYTTHDSLLKIVGKDGLMLCHATSALKDDKIMVKTAVSNNGHAFRYASKNIQNDYEIAMTAVKNKGVTLMYASPTLKNNREIVKTAISDDGCALKYASKDIQNDYDIAMVAVENNGFALAFVSPTLKDNREIVIAATMNQPRSFCHASDRFKSDIWFICYLKKICSDTSFIKYSTFGSIEGHDIALSLEEKKVMKECHPDGFIMQQEFKQYEEIYNKYCN